jgi:hypothetical protein
MVASEMAVANEEEKRAGGRERGEEDERSGPVQYKGVGVIDLNAAP